MFKNEVTLTEIQESVLVLNHEIRLGIQTNTYAAVPAVKSSVLKLGVVNLRINALVAAGVQGLLSAESQ